MNYTELAPPIVSLISLLIGAFLFYNSKMRKADAEALKAEEENITAYAAEWKELYEKKEKRVEELDGKIDVLYTDINELRKMNRELHEKNTELIVKNGALEFRKCNRHGCPDREPPSEF